ncbi:MAG: RNA-binding protein [Comamonadaceae bacterium]|nr:RNA-binding protein [Comamonadaceae bacterium]
MTDAGERLAKRLAAQLPCSRREAELYIEGGWVQVDGAVVEAPGARVAPGQQVTLAPGARAQELPPVTLLLHKPAGLDAEGAQALLAPAHRHESGGPPVRVLQRHFRQLECVAPLPAEAGGLVVYTQDRRVARYFAEGAATLEHECLAEVAGSIAPNGLQRLCHGLALDGQMLPPTKVSWQSERRLRFALKGVHPGQVGAMCAAVGLALTALQRIRIGRLPLAKLPAGQWRYAQPWERF